MSLEEAIKDIQKQFGKESIIKMGEKGRNVEVISTGSFALDQALGVGGLPKGRIVEVFGVESSGKSTLALHIVAEAQKAGGNCAFIDAENGLDISYAENIGVDVENLLISQPNCGDDALEIVDKLVRSNEIAVIIVDSVAALTPRAELEGDMGDAHMGLQARLMGQAMRKLTGYIAKTNCIVVFINQIRSSLSQYGSPKVTPGGNALKFYASIRLEIKKVSQGQIKKGKDFVGQEIVIKVVKNKVAPPFKEANTSIIFGKGIDKYSELVDQYVHNGTIEKAGSWFQYKNEKIQGKENMAEFLKNEIAQENPSHAK